MRFGPGDRVQVAKIDRSVLRQAGYVPTRTPPRKLKGQRGTVTRMTINGAGMWVGFGRITRRRPYWWTRANKREREIEVKHGEPAWEVDYPEHHVFAPHELKLVRRARD